MSLAKDFGGQVGSWREDVPFNSWEYADFTSATGVNKIEFDANNQPIVHTAIRGYSFEYFKENVDEFLLYLNEDYHFEKMHSIIRDIEIIGEIPNINAIYQKMIT